VPVHICIRSVCNLAREITLLVSSTKEVVLLPLLTMMSEQLSSPSGAPCRLAPAVSVTHGLSGQRKKGGIVFQADE
jgi:hypothetical protein